MSITDGAKRLYDDSKLGFLVSTAVTTVALGLVEWLGSIDFSNLPTFAATWGAVLVGQLSGVITAWAAKRGKPTTAGSAGDGDGLL
jgi:hypothetical protein